MRFLELFKKWILVLFFLLGITLFVLHVTIFFYPYQVIHSSKAIQQDHQEVLQYLHGIKPTLSSDFFSERELQHMHDVRLLFLCGIGIEVLFIISLIVLLVKKIFSLEMWYWYSKRVFLLFSVLLILFFVLYWIIDFYWLFYVFHLLLFRNDLWLLPVDSYLLFLYPQTYFLSITLSTLVGIFVVLLVCFILLRFLYKRKTRLSN